MDFASVPRWVPITHIQGLLSGQSVRRLGLGDLRHGLHRLGSAARTGHNLVTPSNNLNNKYLYQF